MQEEKRDGEGSACATNVCRREVRKRGVYVCDRIVRDNARVCACMCVCVRCVATCQRHIGAKQTDMLSINEKHLPCLRASLFSSLSIAVSKLSHLHRKPGNSDERFSNAFRPDLPAKLLSKMFHPRLS